MEKHDLLKNRILEYLLKDDVIEDENTISLYNLIKSLESKFDELNDIMDTSDLVDKINDSNKFKNLFPSKKEVFYRIYPEIDDKRKISITFITKRNHKFHKKVIYKEVGDDYIYSSLDDEVLSSKIFNTFYDDIMKIFNVLEEFALLYKEGDVMRDSRQKIMNEDFDIAMYYNTLGRFYYTFSFNEKIDPNHIQFVEWVNREDIPKLMKKYKNDIMKKIPVKMDELYPVCRNIVIKNRNKQKKLLKRNKVLKLYKGDNYDKS